MGRRGRGAGENVSAQCVSVSVWRGRGSHRVHFTQMFKEGRPIRYGEG